MEETPGAATDPVIDLVSDDYFMREALREARKAYRREEVPIGAVVVRQRRIIARAFNQVEMLKDATAHAEMLAITQAQSALNDWRLNECTLYVTKEPCPMCAGACVNARMGRIVFGAGDPRTGATGGLLNLVQHSAFNHQCELTGAVREEECRTLLVDFFQQQRLLKKSRDEQSGGAERG